jgi:hypothetical protein
MGIDKKSMAIAILIITLGSGWLLTTLGVGTTIHWVWTMGLAVTGLLVFLVSGIDKVSVVVGPLFIFSSILSILRQQERLRVDVELPILVILTGLLLLISGLKRIPAPKWFTDAEKNDGENKVG